MIWRAEGGLHSFRKWLTFVLVPGERWRVCLSTVSGFPDLALLWAQVQARDTESRVGPAQLTVQCEQVAATVSQELWALVFRGLHGPSSFVALAPIKVVWEGLGCVARSEGNTVCA